MTLIRATLCHKTSTTGGHFKIQNSSHNVSKNVISSVATLSGVIRILPESH